MKCPKCGMNMHPCGCGSPICNLLICDDSLCAFVTPGSRLVSSQSISVGTSLTWPIGLSDYDDEITVRFYQKECDCGARVAKTTHQFWCSAYEKTK